DGRRHAPARSSRCGERDRGCPPRARAGAVMDETQPLAGRRLWLAGIGGAGMSAYALLAAGWGAEVSGWDRAETPYLGPLRAAGIAVHVALEPPAASAGAERYVSSAYAGIEGRPRADLLAELVSLRRSI